MPITVGRRPLHRAQNSVGMLWIDTELKCASVGLDPEGRGFKGISQMVDCKMVDTMWHVAGG